MENDKPLVMSTGVDVRVHTLDDGTKLFRLDPNDNEFVPAVLIDGCGRERLTGVTKSTVLIMVPMAEFGAWPYDPIWKLDPATGQMMRSIDEHGRHAFAQRTVMAKQEVFDATQQILDAQAAQSRVVLPSGRDLMGLIRP